MSELGDLPPGTWEQIETVLARFPSLRWVKLYGSRAMGRQRPASDIDLAFSSPEDCSAALAGAIEELPIPYKVDVTHWESLSHAGLRRHIESVGILLTLRAGCEDDGLSASTDRCRGRRRTISEGEAWPHCPGGSFAS
jgi:predicted nucleotidyltransferase